MANKREENSKRINLYLDLDYYNNVFSPALKKSGKNISDFIREAITEKIEKDCTHKECTHKPELYTQKPKTQFETTADLQKYLNERKKEIKEKKEEIQSADFERKLEEMKTKDRTKIDVSDTWNDQQKEYNARMQEHFKTHVPTGKWLNEGGY